jgi:hypothetical protein
MVRKTRLLVVQPLTKITRESLETASEWGLLNDIERTLFPEKAASKSDTRTASQNHRRT